MNCVIQLIILLLSYINIKKKNPNNYVIIPYLKSCTISKFKFSKTIYMLTSLTEPGLKLVHSIAAASYQTLLMLFSFWVI